MVICEVCGNRIESTATVCPFCQSPCTQPAVSRGEILHRTLNLEKGMPLVEQALERLRKELYVCRRQGVRVITLIHGYGSSGKGGSIRREVRRHLRYMQHQRLINDILPGEEFSRKSGHGRQLVRRFPVLADHRDLNRANPGITLVVL